MQALHWLISFPSRLVTGEAWKPQHLCVVVLVSRSRPRHHRRQCGCSARFVVVLVPDSRFRRSVWVFRFLRLVLRRQPRIHSSPFRNACLPPCNCPEPRVLPTFPFCPAAVPTPFSTSIPHRRPPWPRTYHQSDLSRMFRIADRTSWFAE